MCNSETKPTVETPQKLQTPWILRDGVQVELCQKETHNHVVRQQNKLGNSTWGKPYYSVLAGVWWLLLQVTNSPTRSSCRTVYRSTLPTLCTQRYTTKTQRQTMTLLTVTMPASCSVPLLHMCGKHHACQWRQNTMRLWQTASHIQTCNQTKNWLWRDYYHMQRNEW